MYITPAPIKKAEFELIMPKPMRAYMATSNIIPKISQQMPSSLPDFNSNLTSSYQTQFMDLPFFTYIPSPFIISFYHDASTLVPFGNSKTPGPFL